MLWMVAPKINSLIFFQKGGKHGILCMHIPVPSNVWGVQVSTVTDYYTYMYMYM